MNLSSIMVVTKNTIEKEWRSFTLIFLLILTGLSIFVAGSLITVLKDFITESFSLDLIGDKSMAIFFVFIGFWSSFLATYFGVSTSASDRESGVILQVLSFPISRSEYVIGRILGCFALVFAYYVFAACLGMSGISLSAGVWVGSSHFLWSIIFNSLIWLSMISLSMFVGLYIPRLSGFLLLTFINLFSWSSYSYFSTKSLQEAFSHMGLLKFLGALFYYLFPHNVYWLEAVNKKLFTPNDFVFEMREVIHFSGSLCLLYIVMTFLFKKKEI